MVGCEQTLDCKVNFYNESRFFENYESLTRMTIQMLKNLYGNSSIISRHREKKKIFPIIQRDYIQHGGPSGRSLQPERDLLQGISVTCSYVRSGV